MRDPFVYVGTWTIKPGKEEEEEEEEAKTARCRRRCHRRWPSTRRLV
jgi:hypothetical protein